MVSSFRRGYLSLFALIFLASCVGQVSQATGVPTITALPIAATQPRVPTPTQTGKPGLFESMLQIPEDRMYVQATSIGPYVVSVKIGDMEVDGVRFAFSRLQVFMDGDLKFDKTTIGETFSISFGIPTVLGLSSDGQQLFLADAMSGEGCVLGTHYGNLRSLDTLHWFEVALTDKFTGNLAASPDGQWIAFVDNNKNQITLISLLPITLDNYYWHGVSLASTSVPFQVRQGPYGFSRFSFVVWSPDSQTFAVTELSDPCYEASNTIRIFAVPDMSLIQECTTGDLWIQGAIWNEMGYFIELNEQALKLDLDTCSVIEE